LPYKGLEVITAVAFRVLMPCELVFGGGDDFSAEDGGSMFLRNFGVHLQVHATTQPRRPTFTKGIFANN
jgi:hypothetical protein